MELLHEVENLNILDTIEEEGLKYIAGYAAHKFIHKYENLGKCAEKSINPESEWINYISRGKIISPCSDLINVARAMNEEFNNYHGSSLQKNPWIFRTLTDVIEKKMQGKCIPREVLLCLIRTRTYIRLKILNKKIAAESNKIKQRKKMTKFTNRK